jgi:hypothetical protein
VEFLRQNSFIIGALTGSLATFLLKLLIDYLHREKRWLGYSVNSRKIVEAGHPDLHIRYKDRDIKRLHSHSVIVRNIGNVALKDIPIRIVSEGGGEIVEHEIQPPEGASFGIVLEEQVTLRIDCDLLNRDEAVTVGFTALDSSNDEVRVVARAENLTFHRITWWSISDIHRKPPEVRICRLSTQSDVGTRPPSTSTPHRPAFLARR